MSLSQMTLSFATLQCYTPGMLSPAVLTQMEPTSNQKGQRTKHNNEQTGHPMNLVDSSMRIGVPTQTVSSGISASSVEEGTARESAKKESIRKCLSSRLSTSVKWGGVKNRSKLV